MTAAKTGEVLLWPCVALLIATGVGRAVDMRCVIKTRRSALTAKEAERWEVRYQIGAMAYAGALGVWCLVALVGSDDPVVHIICLSVTAGYVAAGGGRTYGRPWIFHVQMLWPADRLSIAFALYGNPYYIGMAVFNAVFFFALNRYRPISRRCTFRH